MSQQEFWQGGESRSEAKIPDWWNERSRYTSLRQTIKPSDRKESESWRQQRVIKNKLHKASINLFKDF